MPIRLAAIALVLVAACTKAESSTAADAIADALARTDRPQKDRELDPKRKPAEVLAFYGVAPGQKIADLQAGGGYYTEILSRTVGPEGTVYATNNEFVIKNYGDGIAERIEARKLENVVNLHASLEDPQLPRGRLDAVIMVLFYHDTYWLDVDRAKMNRAIYDALEPGGVYGVIDHHGAEGTGTTQVKTLHRIEADLVKREILAAGFEWDGELDALRNPGDDLTLSVFDPSIRRRTDRFVYRFRKPR